MYKHTVKEVQTHAWSNSDFRAGSLAGVCLENMIILYSFVQNLGSPSSYAVALSSDAITRYADGERTG